MTTEQKEALNRVRANYTAMNDEEFEVGSYRTDDIRTVLGLFEEQEQVLSSVKSDLNEIKDCLEMNDEDPDVVAISMVDSTLLYLNGSEF